ncbi:MAG: dihydrofolate reductase family protein [Bacteroidota bacterium]
MEKNRSKTTIHMVASLDGFIAKPDKSIDWMHSQDMYEHGIELSQKEINDFLAGIDCYVMGSKTYERALELGWPYGDTPVVVLTSRKLPIIKDSVSFYAGDLTECIQDHLKTQYRNIWIVGGAALTREILRLQLADELVVSIMPILIGGGKLFFEYIGMEQPLHLVASKAYKDGMVELTYAIVK